MNFNSKQITIIEIAEKMFAEYGYDGASIRAIAKEANVNIAMISYYFGSKEKLLEALFEYKTAHFAMQLETIVSKNIDYFDKIDEMVEIIIKRVHKNRRIFKIIHFEYSNDNRQINFENYIDTKKKNYELFENFIRQGQQAGVFSKNVNCHLIIPTILGSYFNIYFNKRFYQELYDIRTVNAFDNFIHTTLLNHVKQTIKGLLTYEK